MTRYTWFIHGHVPVTFGGQDSKTVFEGLWAQAFIDAKVPAEQAGGAFSVLASADGNDPATHIYFSTPLTQRLFWYIGTRMAGMLGQSFPVEDGDTTEEIMTSPNVATFLATLQGLGVYVTISRNDMGQNNFDHVTYLSNYSLQPITGE